MSQPGNLLFIIRTSNRGVILKCSHLHLKIADLIFSLSVFGRDSVGSIGIDTALLFHLLELGQGFLDSLFTFTSLPLDSDTPGPFGSELVPQVTFTSCESWGSESEGYPEGRRAHLQRAFRN